MDRRKADYALAGALALATFTVYLLALRNGFVDWDDGPYVVENPFIRSLGPSLFRWAFSSFYQANWHPLTWISHALDYALWGLNPMGHHLTNIVLHAGNTFLVALLTFSLLKRYRERMSGGEEGTGVSDGRGRSIAASVTALLFGLHPLHVESVAWVAERKDLLCAFFFLLSIMMYVTYAKGNGQRAMGDGQGAEATGQKPKISLAFTQRAMRYALCFFTLALLSKPMAVSLPAVLLILDWFPFKRIQSGKSFFCAVGEKLPFIALSVVSSLLTIQAQRSAGAMAMSGVVPFLTRMLVAARSVALYSWEVIWPAHLIPVYQYPRDLSLWSPGSLAAIAFVTGISTACFFLARKEKLPMAAWAYYVITLIPVLGLLQVGGQSMADRYMYLPSCGPFLVIGVAAASISPSLVRRGVIRKAFVAAVILLFSAMTLLTVSQIRIWKDDITFWGSIIEKEPRTVSLAYFKRGLAYDRAGQFEKAAEDYETSIEIEPFHDEVFIYRGILYDRAGMQGRALRDFDMAVGINPKNPAAYFYRGYSYARTGQNERAFLDYDRALHLNENLAVVYVHRGDLFLRVGNRQAAFADFQRACLLGSNEGCMKGRE